MHSSEYLAAFMGGFEFVLRAFEGRVHAEELDPEAKAALEGFVADYRRVLNEYTDARLSDDKVRAELALTLPRLN